MAAGPPQSAPLDLCCAGRSTDSLAIERKAKTVGTTFLSLAFLCALAPQVETKEQAETLLYISTTPSGAEILVDGKRVGVSDNIFHVEPGVRRIIVELDGHDPQGKEVTIRGGEITRVRLKLTKRPGPIAGGKPAAPVAGDGPGKPAVRPAGAPGQRPRHFVRLVVGKDIMTFEGQKTEWGTIAPLLEKVPDRPRTVLEIAKAKGELGMDQWAKRWSDDFCRASTLARFFKFEYVDDVGPQSPSSKGSPTQTALEGEARPGDQRTWVHLYRPGGPLPGGAGWVHDLATGETLGPSSDPMVMDFPDCNRLGKGDLACYSPDTFSCLRGAKALVSEIISHKRVVRPLSLAPQRATGRLITYPMNLITYQMPELPCFLLVTTAENKHFEVTLLSVSQDGGLNFEYKPADPAVVRDSAGIKRVLLAQAAGRDEHSVLDLASGTTLACSKEADHDPGVFTRLGKGDLLFHDEVVACLRGAKAMQWDGKGFVPLPVQEQEKDGTAYKLPELPCRLLITTAEKKHFDVTVLPVTPGTKERQFLLEYRPAESPPTAKAERDWGAAVEGVQMRVRAEKSTWPQGTMPKLFADLRNQGKRNLRIALEHESWEMEIDGKWHKTNVGVSGLRRYLPLGPGGEQQNLEPWIFADDNVGRKLRALEPGKHTLRVARLIPEFRPGEDVFRVVSERVEIEIAAPGPEAAKDRPADSIRGRVLDHTGKPVAGAVVYLAGSKTIEWEKLVVWDGKPQSLPGPAAETDQQGRFVLTRAGAEKNRLVVNSPGLVVWVVPLPEPGKEATITLPQPATLKIRCDIPGAGDQAQFHLHLNTWQMEGWKGLSDSRQYTHLIVANPGESVLGNLTPGPYDLSRKKDLRVGDYGMGLFYDHRDITLEAGKTLEADFVRKAGQPILGQVVGLKDISVAGAFIFIKPAATTDDQRKGDAFWNTIFDVLTCGVEGQFKTEPIPPGEYTVLAHAYKKPDNLQSGERLPDYLGTAKVTVRAEGPPPQVRIEMKARGEFEKAAQAMEKAPGPAVEGVQLRVRAEKPAWPQGSLPKLFADLRNLGKRNLRIAIESESWEIEIDGKWHQTDHGFEGDRSYLPLGPGGQQQDLEVWVSADDNLGQRLRALEPGKHTLRVARLIPQFRPGEDVFRVLSNPVEVEITAPPPDAAKGPSQSEVGGLVPDGKEILKQLKSSDAVYEAAFTASGMRPGWPKSKWKLTMLDGEIVYEEQIVEIPQPPKDVMGQFIPFRRTYYVGPKVQANHDWVGRIRRYGPLDPWPENSPGPATGCSLKVAHPDAPTLTVYIRFGVVSSMAASVCVFSSSRSGRLACDG